jgi:hypothetical protein
METMFEFAKLSLSDLFNILFPLRYETTEISTVFLEFSWLCYRKVLQLVHWESNDVAFRQSVAAEFRLTDTMLHSQLVLRCLSLTLRKVRGNKYRQNGVSEITKYGRKQESKPQLLHVYNKSPTLRQACSDCWHITFVIQRMRQKNKKEKGKLYKAVMAREPVLRHKYSE